jgi:O-antigen ligase
LLLSIARMTILACLVQVVLLAILMRRHVSLLGMVGGALVVLAAAIILVPGVGTFVWETLTWQTSSSEGHMKDWSQGLDAFMQRPFGSGLGTADLTAQRAGLVPLTADNLYLKYAVEMGVLGLLAHVVIIVGSAVAGWKAFRRGLTESQRNIGAVVLATSIGVAMNAITAVLYSDMVLAYLYFWLVGVAVTVALRGRDSSPSGALQ